ncbi:MAG: thioredoxin family protein [Verrucomicrobia bacterium]|nr:thioredoxin family protein [Verrucomicrobiota bacterium]
MKKLQILGTGCAKCNALTEATKKAADELGLEYEIGKVADIKDIMAFGVMRTPALAIDGTVKVTGKVPSHTELKALLSATD